MLEMIETVAKYATAVSVIVGIAWGAYSHIVRPLSKIFEAVDYMVPHFKKNGGNSLLDRVDRIEQGITDIRSEQQAQSDHQAYIDVRGEQAMDGLRLGTMRTNARGEVIAASSGAELLAGHSERHLLGNDWLNFVDPADVRRVGDRWEEAIAEKRRVEEKFAFIKSDGYQSVVKMKSRPIFRAETNELLGFVIFLGSAQAVTWPTFVEDEE